MDAAASIKLMSHNLKGQTEITVSLIGDNMYLRDQLYGCQGRIQALEAQLVELRKPGPSGVNNENTNLRVLLAEAQSRLKTIQDEVTEERRQRRLAEEGKLQYLTECKNLLQQNDTLRKERHEAERRQDNQSDANMATLAQYNALQDTMAALRLELQGKDREVQELAGTVRMLQEQLEQAQAPREEPQPSVDAQSETVLDKLDYMQERQTFRDQLAALQKENEELKAKVALFEAAIQPGTGTVAPSALQRAGTQTEVSTTKATSSQPCRKKNGTGKKETMASYPMINISLPPELVGPFSFTKTELSQLLGGSTQGLFVRVTKSARPLAVKYDINEYLCPNLNQNSWLPTKPGAHGYMQVGLGDRDRARFNEPEVRPVFVGAESQFRYFGTYELTRVEPLTAEEWLTLPEKSQYEYSETTKDKEKAQRSRNVDDILQDYRAGTLRAPCVLLKCIGFDMDFYRDFIDAARTYNASFGVAATPASTPAPPATPAPSACTTTPARAGQKRPAENRFHVQGTDGQSQGGQGGSPAPKRSRTSQAPTLAMTTPRRSGRISMKPPPSGLAALVTGGDDGDADGISSDSSTEFNADDE